MTNVPITWVQPLCSKFLRGWLSSFGWEELAKPVIIVLFAQGCNLSAWYIINFRFTSLLGALVLVSPVPKFIHITAPFMCWQFFGITGHPYERVDDKVKLWVSVGCCFLCESRLCDAYSLGLHSVGLPTGIQVWLLVASRAGACTGALLCGVPCWSPAAPRRLMEPADTCRPVAVAE